MLSQTASTHSFSWSDWGLSACSSFAFCLTVPPPFGLPVCIFSVLPAVSPPICLCSLFARSCSLLAQTCSSRALGLDCQSNGVPCWHFYKWVFVLRRCARIVPKSWAAVVVVGGPQFASVRAAGYDGDSFGCLFQVPAVSACPARRMQHTNTGFPACVLGITYIAPHPNHCDFTGAFVRVDSEWDFVCLWERVFVVLVLGIRKKDERTRKKGEFYYF